MGDQTGPSIWPTVIFELALGGIGLGVAYAAGFWRPADWLTIGAPYHADTVEHVMWAIVWGTLATLPMFAVLGLVNLLPIPGIKELSTLVDNELIPMFSGKSWIALLAAAVSAGVGEEILFRWTIQTGFAQGLDVAGATIWGVVIASVVFGLMHWLTSAYAILAGLIAVYLGIELLLTESLLAVIITHALYDFVILMYLTRFRKPKATAEPSGSSSP